jgi:hypothetical protein
VIRKTSLLTKKFPAAFLLMVLLAIHVAKLVHTHEPIDHIDCNTQQIQIAQDNDCPVCEYQFTKDADFSFSRNNQETVVNFSSFSPHNTASPVISFCLGFEGRGPPSIG